ncbi:MAG: hypothetical protein ACOZAR_01075 [Patescibacteria group bacterium]
MDSKKIQSDISQVQTKAKDHEIKATTEQITIALEAYYTINGFYPPDNHIEYLWSGNRKVIDKEPSLPEECGKINQDTERCGVVYSTKKESQGYILKIKYLLLKPETIDRGIEGDSISSSENNIETIDEPTNYANQAPKINPVLFDELTGNPGEQLSIVETIKNPSSKPMLLEISIQNFLPKEGNSDGVPEMTDKNTDYAMKDWISFDPPQIVLEPASQKEIKFHLSIPPDAKAGGRYAALTFMTKNSDQNSDPNKLAVQSGIGSLVLLRVNGSELSESGSVEKFYSSINKNTNNIELILEFSNTGNVHFKPFGAITVYDAKNNIIAEIDLDIENVLPGSTRKITTNWQYKYSLDRGQYRAELNGYFGQSHTKFFAETKFTI